MTNDDTSRAERHDSAHEDLGVAAADRAPTVAEDAAAERAAAGVDVDEVGQHFTEMAERGANVAGEGEIEPRPGTTGPSSLDG